MARTDPCLCGFVSSPARGNVDLDPFSFKTVHFYYHGGAGLNQQKRERRADSHGEGEKGWELVGKIVGVSG